MPGRIETEKSGAVIFLISSSVITSLAICRRFEAQSCRRSRRSCISAIRPLSPCHQRFIGKRGAHKGGQYFMHVGEPLHRVGEGLFIDLGVFRADPVADTAIGNGGEFEIHGRAPVITPRQPRRVSCVSMVLTSTFDSLSVVIVSVEGQLLLIGFLLNVRCRPVNRKTIVLREPKIGDHPAN